MGTENNPAVVLGMYETGLAVGRSLGKEGVNVLGFDHTRKIGFYSRHVRAAICPHPIEREDDFIKFLVETARACSSKPVLFITADEYLGPVSRKRKLLQEYFLMNLPNEDIVESIADKFKQFRLAVDAGIPVPQTLVVSEMNDVCKIRAADLSFPAFIKGVEVTAWRKHFGGHVKGFVINNMEELVRTSEGVFRYGIPALIQELIPGPDTQHFKSSFYVSREGEILLAFGLQKIRQQPVGFGFGCVVQSIEYPELLALGRQFFERIGYRGVGSAEFKLDHRDMKLKLIELNPRYWQQNGLAEKCGMNFPFMNYRDLTAGMPQPILHYKCGVKWINVQADFDSFREYRRRRELSFIQWVRSWRGEKMYSDLALNDPVPGLHAMLTVLPKATKFIIRRLLRVCR